MQDYLTTAHKKTHSPMASSLYMWIKKDAIAMPNLNFIEYELKSSYTKTLHG